MRSVERVFTAAEAAVLTEIDLKSLHNAIDKGVIEAEKTGDRQLTGDDVLLLKLWHGLGATLATGTRRRLFEAVLTPPRPSRVRADEFLIVDVAAARRRLKARLRLLIEAEAAVHQVPGLLGGEPVFIRTRIPVRMVAAMLRDGADRAEILAGYPKLDHHLLDLAPIWAAAHPARGRPRSLRDFGAVPVSSTRLLLSDNVQPGGIVEDGLKM